MELTTKNNCISLFLTLFMMSKIQNLNGTHNKIGLYKNRNGVVYDVKDTKFEWNSQLTLAVYNIRMCCL